MPKRDSRSRTNPIDLSRRGVLRGLPAFAILSAMGGIGRIFTACTVYEPNRDTLVGPRVARNPSVVPSDDDEYVPSGGDLDPINAGDAPPSIPNAAWEARAKQLESEQARLNGAVFTADPSGNGIMAGKERSHVPRITRASDLGAKRVTVVVEHVMVSSRADAGQDADARAPAPGAAPDAGLDGSADGASDAGTGMAPAATADGGPSGTIPPDHYVTTIYLRAVVDATDVVVGLWEFASTDPAPPSVTFTLPQQVTSVVAYEWCTLHGLWKSDSLEV